MVEYASQSSFRNPPFRKPKKTEPYGLVKNQRFYRDAYKDKRLTSEAKALLAYIISYCNADGSCFPSLSKIAEDVKVTRQAIQNRLRPLITFGYVIRKKRYTEGGTQTSNTYYLNFSPEEEDYSKLTETSCTTATSGDCTTAISENCPPATPESCTKIPFKIPDNKYSEFNLNRILKEAREIAGEDLEPLQRANITIEIQNKARSIQDEINQHIEHGMGRGIPAYKFERLFNSKHL